MGPEELCGKSVDESRAFHIFRFVKEIYSYKFEEEPDYSKLIFFLEKVLMEIDQAPKKKYDLIKEEQANS